MYTKKIRERRRRNKKGRLHRDFLRRVRWIFLIFITIIPLLNILSRNKEYSQVENRPLEQRPKFTVSSYINDQYNKKFSSYYSDQFFLRDFWMKLKLNSQYLMGRKDLNGVYIGKDGYLFSKDNYQVDEETEKRVQHINNFAKKHKDKDISFMIIPSSREIYSEKLPKNAPIKMEINYIDYIEENLAKKINFINPLQSLLKDKDKYIYYRTDHHWTSNGAFSAYKNMARSLDYININEKDYKIMKAADGFKGSYDGKISGIRGRSDSIQIYAPKNEIEMIVRYDDSQEKKTSLYIEDRLDIKDKYQVFTGGNHSLIKIKTDNKNGRKALVIKDSFANSLLPFMSQNYEELLVVDMRMYSSNLSELIELESIEEVIFIYSIGIFQDDASIYSIK